MSITANKKGKKQKKTRSGAADALVILISTAVILVCVLLLKSLRIWLTDDAPGSFSRIWETIRGAVFIGK